MVDDVNGLTCCRFDVAGAGACLKRFTDPSFFKMESTSLTGRKLEGQRDKKTRRVKVERYTLIC